MSQIQVPKEWESNTLSDNIVEVEKFNPKSTPLKKFKYVEIASIDTDKKIISDYKTILGENAPSRARNKIKTNDIIYATTRPYYRNIAIIPKELNDQVCSTGFCVLRVKNQKKIEPRYMFYFLLSNHANNQILKSMRGGSYPAVSNRDVENIKFLFPQIKTQKKIVQKLDYILDQLKEKKKEILSIIEQNKEKIEFFEKNWVSFIISKEIESHPQRKEWEIFKLKELTNAIGDGIHSTPNYVQNSDYYFINGNNLRNGSIVITEKTKMVDEAEYHKYKLELTDKTVLLSINGTIGNLAFYRKEKVILGKSACYINCNDKLDVEFLFYLLQSNLIKNYFRKEQTQTSIYNLSLASIRKTPVFLPSLPEQKKIVQKIKNIEKKFNNQITQFQKIKEKYEHRITYVNHIQSSILETAFSGNLVN